MVENMKDKVGAQVLVVEDELEIRELMWLLLLRQGHRVQQASSVEEAKSYINNAQFDILIVDWMLPQTSGLELVKQLKNHSQNSASQMMPILMVTAKAEAQDIVTGLEAGADDYITKPFEPAVFQARVRALLRRRPANPENELAKETIHIGQLSINMATFETKCHGEPVHLTPSEFKILSTMATMQGRVLTRDYLVEVVQGEGISVTGRTVDTHVFGLRKKLGDCADWIETIRGVGYRIKL